MPEKTFQLWTVTNFRGSIIKSCELASESLIIAHGKSRQYKIVNTKTIMLQPGTDVLLLLPDVSDRLSIKWQGPFKVIRKIPDVDYLISIRGKENVFHINMLTKFYKQDQTSDETPINMIINQPDISVNDKKLGHPAVNSVKYEKDEEETTMDIIKIVMVANMTYKDVSINPALPAKDTEDLLKLVKKFAPIFSNILGKSKTVRHHIRLTLGTKCPNQN